VDPVESGTEQVRPWRTRFSAGDSCLSSSVSPLAASPGLRSVTRGVAAGVRKEGTQFRARRASIAPLLVLFVAGPLPAARGEEKVLLRLNLEAGQSYTLSWTSRQDMTVTIDGQQQRTSQTLGLTFTLKATKVEADGTIHGTFTYDSVRLASRHPAGDVDYDSADPAAPAPTDPMAKAMAALVGQTLDVVLTPRGAVKDLRGGDKLVRRMLKAMDLPEAERPAAERQMRAMFGDAALKQNLQRLTEVYPPGPVKVGDTWEVVKEVDAGMPMTVRNTYTLKSLDGGKATLDVKGVTKTNPDVRGPLQTRFALEGTQSGSLVLDQETGWFSSGHLTTSLDGQVTSDEDGQKVAVPMKIRSELAIEQ
jgi:hypothetical protein